MQNYFNPTHFVSAWSVFISVPKCVDVCSRYASEILNVVEISLVYVYLVVFCYVVQRMGFLVKRTIWKQPWNW